MSLSYTCNKNKIKQYIKKIINLLLNIELKLKYFFVYD